MEKQIVNISNDFSFSYQDVPLFQLPKDCDSISFDKGKVYGIFGENGSGKTTFLNLINAFLIPTTGSITYSFKDLNYINKSNSKNIKILFDLISNKIRRCFQVPFLVDELSVYSNISIAKRIYKEEEFIKTFSITKSPKCKDEGIVELLEIVNINGDVKADTLSYGQRRLVSNLQVLFSNPELIILDEPFSNLHLNVIEKIKKMYIKKVKSCGTTIIIVEHLPQNIENFADEIILIKNKKLLVD